MTASQKETLGFQTEAKQLLHLMIHSLYSNKEVFLRELVSNASDAADKLRFEALNNGALYENDPELKITVTADEEAKTVTITDNGIGMSRDEVISHLGTIARSGTSEFLKNLSGDQKKDSQLIGQFGVGFYSAFIVADKVEVFSRRAGLPADQGVRWESSGEADFSIELITREQRGTSIVLHLRSEESEFANDWRLRSIIKKYSDHIAIPVVMAKYKNDEEKEKNPELEFEAVNQATALWTRSRSEVNDDEYKEFYKHISHDYEEPLTWSHNKVEGKLEYTSLLYIPKRAPMDMWNREGVRGLKLYVQRTFIMDEADQFMPMYQRFVKGVIDSQDLPLNVSREILQIDKNVESIKGALSKRVLDMLEKLAKNEPEQYQAFWDQFGQVMKEGPAEDVANREKIASLLRFASTYASEGDSAVATQNKSLDEYIARMKPEQNKIYFIAAENYTTAANSPHLEIFRKKGIEVLLLSDRVDEWLMSHLMEYKEKSFQDISRGQLDLGDLEDKEEKQVQEQLEKEHQPLVERIKIALADKAEKVRITHRLTDSPACLAIGENDMGAQMRKLMESIGQAAPESKPIFEVNPLHPLIERLSNEQDESRFAELTHVLFDQAQLAEGRHLEDPAAYVHRLNRLLLELSR